jgi:hypothetical protein
MADCFERRLAQIAWPRETQVAFDLVSDILRVDVDLPEIEDMPQDGVKLRKTEYRLVETPKNPTLLRKEYMTHIHAVIFRIVGEAFGSLPTLRETMISGYSQRQSRATGNIEDEYLLSVRVGRAAWERIDFGQLEKIDPASALARFELRRNMTATGLFKPIVPLV